MSQPSQHFIEDSMRWRGRVLTGKYAHWCFDWDDLPIDETCLEWPCGCGIKEHIDGLEAITPPAAPSTEE